MMISNLSNGELDHLSMNHPGLTNICIHFHSVFYELKDKRRILLWG